MLHLHVPKERGRLPWEVMSQQSGLRGLTPSPDRWKGNATGEASLYPDVSLFPATPNMEPDLGKGLEC